MRHRIVAIVAVIICIFVVSAQADNTERLKVLREEAIGINSKYQQAQQFIEDCKARALEINGAIKELRQQDAEAKAATLKKEAKKAK
jgi:hypothetical protein